MHIFFQCADFFGRYFSRADIFGADMVTANISSTYGHSKNIYFCLNLKDFLCFFFKFRLAAQIAEEHPSCIINAKCAQETFSATFSLLKKWKHLELQITTFPTITIQLYL